MIIISLFLIVMLILVFKYIPTSPTLQFNEKNEDSNLMNNKELDYKMYYKPKTYIITKREGIFSNILFEIAKELDYMLFTQVSLYNIIKMQDNLDYSTKIRYFNKIASKSIDFVLTDKEYRIKLCIELDDITHKEKDRIERDKFINKLFSDLGISMLRYPTYNTYYKDTLKKRILENIKDDVVIQNK